jgi:hypothetical protein
MSLCQSKVPIYITISGDCGNNKPVSLRVVAGSHEWSTTMLIKKIKIYY